MMPLDSYWDPNWMEEIRRRQMGAPAIHEAGNTPIPPAPVPPVQQPGHMPPGAPVKTQAPAPSLSQGLKKGIGGALSNLGQYFQTPQPMGDPNLGHAALPNMQRPMAPQLNMPQYHGLGGVIQAMVQQAGGNFGGYRAMGGPMYPGYRYRVGERGPEDVMMHPDGTASVQPLTPPGSEYGDISRGYQDVQSQQAMQPEPEHTSYGVNDDILGAADKMNAPPQLKLSARAQRKQDMSPQDFTIDDLERKRAGLLQRGEKHVSKGASALSYLFQGMENFGDRMSGIKPPPVVPLGQQRFSRELGKIDQRLGPLYEQKHAQLENDKLIAETGRANRQYQADQNKELKDDFWKTANFQHYITPEQAAYAKSIGIVGIPDDGIDSRDFDTFMSGGKQYATPKLGPPDLHQTNLPPEPGSEVFTQKIPGTNETTTTTGKEALNRANQIEVANTNYKGRTAQANAAITRQNATTTRDYKKDHAAWWSKQTDLINEGNSLYNQGGDKLIEAEKLEKEAADIRAKAGAHRHGDVSGATKKEEEARKLRIEGQELQEKGKAKTKQAVDDAKNEPKEKDYAPQKPLTAPQLNPPQISSYKGYLFRKQDVPEIKKQHPEWQKMTDDQLVAYLTGQGAKWIK